MRGPGDTIHVDHDAPEYAGAYRVPLQPSLFFSKLFMQLTILELLQTEVAK